MGEALIQITGQTLITASAVIVAALTLIGFYNKIYNWYRKQQEQDTDIAAIKQEQSLIVYALLACLKGLKEQGCDGPVTEAIAKIEKHVNQKAHE